MRVLLFWSYYDQYIHSVYTRQPQLNEMSYKEQVSEILSDNFGWSPALVEHLRKMGHEVEILLVNIEPLQRAWTEENSCEFDQKNWQYTIPLEQVKRFSPDVLWIGAMFNYFGDYLGQLKQYCNKIFAWTACPITKQLDLSHIDCMLTSHANYQSYFQEQGKAAEILLPCFEQDILATSTTSHRDVECSFIGALSWAHIARIDTIKKLADKTPIQIWSDYPKLISRGILKPKFWNAYLKLSTIKSRMNTSVWGMDMYGVLARSKITINVHAEVASGLAGNMRMFEATGMGTLLITEDAPNIRELYEPGTEVITYKSTENLVELINYYIDRPQERESIAQAGQARTLKDHSTAQRSKELIEIFTRYLQL
jgi:spore maturation protein CgeB